MAHTCMFSMQEAEAGGLQVGGHPGLHSEILSHKQQTKSTYQKVFTGHMLCAKVLGKQVCKLHLSVMNGDK